MREWTRVTREGGVGAARVYADGEQVFARGDPASHVYFLREGSVEIVQRSSAGAAIVVKILVGPTLFGAIEPLASEPAFLETVRVLSRAVVHAMPTAKYLALLESRPHLAFESLIDTARAFCVAARFESSRLDDTEALLANLLLAYVELFGVDDGERVRIELRRTQADLADAIGAGERSVNRILTAWERDGVLVKTKGNHVIARADFLVERAGDLYGSLVHRWATPTAVANVG